MKVLVLTDSLGLPRNKPEICSFEETWPILLRKTHPNIHQVSIGSATTDTFIKQINYHKDFRPDVVVIQVGIVDCVPRFMSQLELEFSKSLGFIGKVIINFANRKWIRRIRNLSYVKPSKFEQNIIGIQNSFNCPVVFIGIVPATKEYEIILPGATDKIKNYNSIIKSNSTFFVDTSKISLEGGLMSDYHHLNIIGHKMIFKNVVKILNDLKVSSKEMLSN